MSLFNAHTHIFNVPSVPDAFLANYKIPTWLGNLLRAALYKKPLRKTLMFILKYVPVKIGGLQIRRFAALVDISLNKYQSEVFANLAGNYDGDARFVVLTMNFDYMTGEVPESNYNHYETQLHEVLGVKEIYGDKILPFLFIDPRMGKQRCIKLLKYYFDKENPRGVVGIKLYPALGYYPFHPDLEPVYAFAAENEIPIMTHAYKGGGGYYTGKFTPNMMSYNSFNPTTVSQNFLNKELTPFNPKKSGRDFADILLHPILYNDVLEKYKNLKICFAHFGGVEEIKNQGNGDKNNWTETIKSYIHKYDNVYTDVSYSFSDEDATEHFKQDMIIPKLNERILFGTDFFLSSVKGSDKKLTGIFSEQLKPHFPVLSVTNPISFLKSSFFTP